MYTLTNVEVDVIGCLPSVSVFNYTHVVSAVGFFSNRDVQGAVAPLSLRGYGLAVLGPSNPDRALRYIAAQMYRVSDVRKLLVLMGLRGGTHRLFYERLFITMQSTELHKVQLICKETLSI